MEREWHDDFVAAFIKNAPAGFDADADARSENPWQKPWMWADADEWRMTPMMRETPQEYWRRRSASSFQRALSIMLRKNIAGKIAKAAPRGVRHGRGMNSAGISPGFRLTPSERFMRVSAIPPCKVYTRSNNKSKPRSGGVFLARRPERHQGHKAQKPPKCSPGAL